MAAMIVCIVLLILAALIFTLLIAGWVYLDAKEHGERGWMWVCIILAFLTDFGRTDLSDCPQRGTPALPLLRMDGGQKRQLLRALRAESPCL